MAKDQAQKDKNYNSDNPMLSYTEIRRMKKYGKATDAELKTVAETLLQLAIILTNEI